MSSPPTDVSTAVASILLVLPVPMRRTQEGLQVEAQAANGLRLWALNFDTVVAAMIVYPASIVAQSESMSWMSAEKIPGIDRIRIIELPFAYSPKAHMKHLRSMRALLAAEIDKARYLSFAIGGLFGDWGTVAADVAHKRGRQYSIWTDRVESRVIRESAKSKKSMLKRLYWIGYSKTVGVVERRAIRNATLGLFHGYDTFDAYSALVTRSFSVHNVHMSSSDRLRREEVTTKLLEFLGDRARAQLVHDVHVGDTDRLPESALAAKTQAALRFRDASPATSNPLRIGYAGRAADMKAPLDWLEVVRLLVARGHLVEATWIGDGPLLPAMRAFIEKHQLGDYVSLPGFISDRPALLAALRSWDILMFTHVTPESPRVLLEALISATPIVGYRSRYPQDLVKGFGDDFLTPLGDPKQLADCLERLYIDRQRLSTLMAQSHQSSAHYNDVAVFKHRSDLIKTHLA